MRIMYLASHHFWVVILKERKDLIRSNPELSFGHVLEISDLDNRVDPAGLKMQDVYTLLENLNSPPQELFELVFVPKNPLVHVLVLENPIGIITNRVSAPIKTMHISHNAFELFESQVLLGDAVCSELFPPRHALDQHVEGVGDPEISGPKKLEEDDVGLVVSGEQFDSPHVAVAGVGGGELVLELLKRLLLGGLELRDQVGVLLERRGAECGDLH